MTGKDGVFDPGSNEVGLSVPGSGRTGLRLTQFFFEALEKEGIPTHYVDANIDDQTMDVRKVTVFGQGLEVICRYVATGSFIRRYGDYATDGQPLPGLVEISLKDDERGDPFIEKETLVALDILTADDHETLIDLTKRISKIVKDILNQHDLQLLDIKFEFGKDVETGEILLIDEISDGNMRVTKDSESVAPLDLADYLLD